MVGELSQDIAALIPGVNRLIVHAPWGYRYLRAMKKNGNWFDDFKFALSMRRERYDLAIDLRGDLLTILPMLFWKIPRRMARATRGGAFALTDIIPPAAKDRRHEVDRTLDVVAFLGAETMDRNVGIEPPGDAITRVRVVFEDYGLDPAKTILLSPGTQWRWRMWPIERFSELIIKLDALSFSIAVIGGREDVSLAERIVHTGKLPGINLAGKFSLVELLAAFKLSRGFVSTESGPVHLAAAAGACGVVLFGPGEQECFGPLTDRIGVLHHPCPLHPCYQRGECLRPEEWCMNSISVDEVIMTLKEKLAMERENKR